MFEQFFRWYLALGASDVTAVLLSRLSGILLTILLSILAFWLSRRVILRVLAYSAKHTHTEWDDILLRSDIFIRLSYLAPAAVVYYMAPFVTEGYAWLTDIIDTIVFLYTTLVGAGLMLALLDGFMVIYATFERSRQMPLRSTIQVLKLVTVFVAALILLSIIFNQSAAVLLSGLGAFTAVLLLIFRDPILGFAAGIQLTANKMVALGDYIEMPKFDAAGQVLDIALTTIKVRNDDQSITTIPTYALISESFKNWRGRDEVGVRRIQRAINLDMNTVTWCDAPMLDKFAAIQHLSGYIAQKRDEVAAYNHEHGFDDSLSKINGRWLTNLGTFRAYVVAYLRNHPRIDQRRTLIVRQLPPEANGLPLEIYAFCTELNWEKFENIQSDIFDHLLAAIPEFGLRVYQSPAGADVRGE